MHDPPAGGHAGRGDDDGGGVVGGDAVGVLYVVHLSDAGHVERVLGAQHLGPHVAVVVLHRPAVDARSVASAIGLSTKMGTSGQRALAVQHPELVQQHLGAVHGEGRDDDRATTVDGAHDRVPQGVDRALVLVTAIAVRRLDDHPVRVGDGIRRHEDRMRRPTQVPAEHHGRPTVEDQPHDRRAQDVAGGPHLHADAGGDLDRLAERDGSQVLERGVGVSLGVQRQRGRMA